MPCSTVGNPIPVRLDLCLLLTGEKDKGGTSATLHGFMLRAFVLVVVVGCNINPTFSQLPLRIIVYRSYYKIQEGVLRASGLLSIRCQQGPREEGFQSHLCCVGPSASGLIPFIIKALWHYQSQLQTFLSCQEEAVIRGHSAGWIYIQSTKTLP